MNQQKLPHRHWTGEEEELLGKKSDRVLARKFRRSVAAVAARRRQHQISLIKPWRPADGKLLGIRPDEQVALLLNRPRHQVAYRRRQLGIPFKHPDYRQWKAGEVAMLGWRTDEEVARLTGCKNISRVRMNPGGSIDALDWGCRVNVAQAIAKPPRYIGIRAHHIDFVEGTDGSAGTENVFPCRLSQSAETPFRVTLFLTLDSRKDTANEEPLQAEVFKEKWQRFQHAPLPWHIRLAPELLFLMPE